MKILAIWITKGLFIFVICIAEWNVCSNLIRYKDYSVVFNENGDAALTLPQDCHIIIACYILQG